MTLALVIFLATYVLIAGGRLPCLGLDRTSGALAGAVAMVVFGVVGPVEAVHEAVNWDTLLLLLGMMILGAAMARAGLFRWVSWLVLRRAHGATALLGLVVATAGALSALLVNDTVCVMCTPLVLALVDDAGLPPTPYLLALAFAANAGSAATLTGNPQNMLIGTLSGIGYRSFAGALALPALAALACVFGVLRVAFRGELERRGPLRIDLPPPPLDRRAAASSACVLALVVSGLLLGHGLAWTALAGAALVLALSRGPSREIFAGVDFVLLIFFAALFVVTHGVARAGIAERLYALLRPALGATPVSQTVRFGLFTVAACQVVSNVPFVLLAQHWVGKLADPRFAWLSLGLVSTLAGNLTPVASVANLIVLESAGERGRIPFGGFVRVGALATFLPLLAGLACLLGERALGLFQGM